MTPLPAWSVDLPLWLADLPLWLADVVSASPLLGHGAVLLAMLVENLVPPVPSEVLLPLAGYLVFRGQLQLLPTLAAALAGTVLGAWFWYGVGRLASPEQLEGWLQRHGGRLGLVLDDLEHSRLWFRRHGSALVFWGRMVPGVRTLISVPAGLERMPQPIFLAWTTAGSLVWTSTLILAGRSLGEGYRQVAPALAPYAGVIQLGLGLALVLGLMVLVIRAVARRG